MKFLPWIRSKFLSRSNKRSYEGAAASRLTADWITGSQSADAAIQGRLGALRDRTRDLERNNEWVRGFARVLENNVLGETGITLQMRVKNPGTDRFDEVANQQIEMAWWRWGKVGGCTLNRKQSWRDVQKLVLRRLAVDGEVLIRKVRTRDGLRLHVIEADLLDLDYHGITNGNNEVRFGVEINPETRAVVAYHMLGWHPGDSLPLRTGQRERIRVPADEMIHLFIEERPDQTRGVPWLIASMKGLRMLDGYAEAELVAARTAASKMGFFTRAAGEGYGGAKDGEGNLRMEAAPGAMEELPEGVTFQAWDPTHPNSAFGAFIKARLRGVASSLGISYNTLSSDLEGVNYSSIRAGLLEEREFWKSVQRFLIEHLCEPIFSEWLLLELMRGAMPLPVSKLAKFDAPEFRGRRWQWVDPKKDIEANILAVRAGFTSQRDVIAQGGGDSFDVFQSQQADNVLAAQMGLKFPELVDAPKASAGRPPEPDDEV